MQNSRVSLYHLGTKYTFILLILGLQFQCKSQENEKQPQVETPKKVEEVLDTQQGKELPVPLMGADLYDEYLPLLRGKRVGVVTNQTGMVRVRDADTIDYFVHLVDYLVNSKIDVQTIFAPEHGFRGTADAGEEIKDGKDVKTGLPIISLYGDNKKPKPNQISNLDIIVFDIQDVGVRFYTYISTLHYVMEAAAEQHIPVVILDRPNPHMNYIDGPMREEAYKSFVGMHPVPVVYGMTIGEYGHMINGEKWMKNGIQCDVTVIPFQSADADYVFPVAPSPNLPNMASIKLYPSLCFFEGTEVSVGRGTNTQFQVYGAPFLPKDVFTYSFTPAPNIGAKDPKHNGKTCYGENLTHKMPHQANFSLQWILKAYQSTDATHKKTFFQKNLFIDKLAGTDKLRKQIIAGKTEEQIRATWITDLESFQKIRMKYLLYKR